MEKFYAATDPVEIDRYQRWVKKALFWISVVAVLAALSMGLAILLNKS